MLYSYRGLRPEPIPFRIILPNGFTRTDPTTFTEEELIQAGFTGPFEEPEYNPKIETIDWINNQFIVRSYNEDEINEKWEEIRFIRNKSLSDTDYTQIMDYNMNLLNQEEWAEYRQKLRDIPNLQTNPFDIVWPKMPK